MKKKLYVVVDVQNDFVTGCLGSNWAKTTSENILHYLKSAKKNENTFGIWATQDTHEEDTYPSSLEGIKLPVPHCINGSKGWDLIDGLNSLVDKTITKPTFMSEELGKAILQIADELDEIVFMGFCTSICVASNASYVRGLLPDMPITVMQNLCADVSEESHKAALLVLNNCQVDTSTAVGACEDCVEEEVFNLLSTPAFNKVKTPILYTSRFYEDLTLDSLDFADLVLTIEERFAIAIDPDVLESIRTVGDLIDTVNKLRTTNTINYGHI